MKTETGLISIPQELFTSWRKVWWLFHAARVFEKIIYCLSDGVFFRDLHHSSLIPGKTILIWLMRLLELWSKETRPAYCPDLLYKHLVRFDKLNSGNQSKQRRRVSFQTLNMQSWKLQRSACLRHNSDRILVRGSNSKCVFDSLNNKDARTRIIILKCRTKKRWIKHRITTASRFLFSCGTEWIARRGKHNIDSLQHVAIM